MLVIDITEETTVSDLEINGPVSPEPIVVDVPKNSIKPGKTPFSHEFQPVSFSFMQYVLPIADRCLVRKKESKIQFESEPGNPPRGRDTEGEDPSDRFWRIDSLVAMPDFLESLKLRRRPITEDNEKKDPAIYSIDKSAPVQATNACDDKLSPKYLNEVVAMKKVEVDSIENRWQDLTEIMKAEGVEESLPYRQIWPHLLRLWNPIENIVPDAEAQLYFEPNLQQHQSLPLLDLTEADFPSSPADQTPDWYPGSSAPTISEVARMKDPLVEDNNDPPSAADSAPIVFTVSLENPTKSHGPRRCSQKIKDHVKPTQLPNSQHETLPWKAVEKMLRKELKQIDRQIEPDRWAKLVTEWKKLQVFRRDDNNNNIVGVPALEKSR